MDCAHAVAELRLILSNALLLPPFSAQGRQSLFALKSCPSLHRLRERMSRRKQDNPMQVKRTLTGSTADEDMDPDPLEADEAPQCDLIQCGDCHINFALADIVKFIAHKRSCYKGQQVPLVVSSNEVHSEDGEDGEVNAAEINSIDTTIHENGPVVLTEKPKILTPFRRKSLLDQGCEVLHPLAKETQTEHLPEEVAHERLICSTCKVSFYSAAELLHHVQIDHGLHIYQQDAKENHSTEMGGQPLKAMLNEREEEKEATTSERHPGVHDSRERGDDEPSTDSKGDKEDKNLNDEPDTADSQVSSSHPQEQPHTHGSHHLPLLSTEHSPLPIYIRHPLGADRYQSAGDRYFPVPLSQQYHMEFGMPPSLHPSEPAPHRIAPHYDGSPHVPFSTATQHTNQVDESAAQRLRLIADGALPCEQVAFPYQRPYRPAFPTKLKSCEFCGKLFKFQSNLIVHRRSHTGEKPYKCSLCDHACSQASKLKRHMKTHKTARSPGDSNNEHRPREPHNDDKESKPRDEDYASSDKHSSSNSSIDGEDEEDPDREEREREEREMEEEEDDDDEMLPNHHHTEATPRKETSRTGSGGSSNQPSLLGEVMKRTGFSEIQQYKDAYQQAVAEQHNFISSPGIGYCPSLPSSFLLSNKKEANGLSLCGSGRHPPLRSSPSPVRLSTSLPSPIRKSLPPLPLNLPANPFSESSPPPLESDRDPPAKRFKHEPTSPPSAITPPRPHIWTSLNIPPQNFFAPVLGIHPHHAPVLPGPIPNGNLGMLTSSHHRRFYPTRSGEPHVAPSVLPTYHHNPHQRRSRGITNRRSDECEFCGKIFKNCSNLTVHRRSHTGEKPYKCELCAYACAQSSKLTRHMKTHGKGAKEVFKCEVCGMPFSVYSTLEKHMKKEHWGSIKGPAPRPEASCTAGRGRSYKPLSK